MAYLLFVEALSDGKAFKEQMWPLKVTRTHLRIETALFENSVMTQWRLQPPWWLSFWDYSSGSRV